MSNSNPKRTLPKGDKVFTDGRITLYRCDFARRAARFERGVIDHPGAVVVVPELPDGKLVMIRSLRFAIGDRLLWEFPAGTLEPGEDPADCARRECEEETGYRPTQIKALGGFYSSPGFCNEYLYLFRATGLVPVGQHLDDAEQIEVFPKTRAEIARMVNMGELEDAKSLAALAKLAAG